MFSDPVSFNGATHIEVITVLANCGTDTDRARRALVTWIRHKQDKGRPTDHILSKLRDIESKFIKDTSLHSAFRDARAETFLPRAPDLPLPDSVRRRSNTLASEVGTSLFTPINTGRASIESISQRSNPPISSFRFSRTSSQMADIFPGIPSANQRLSLPRNIRLSQTRSPRIQIPLDQSSRPGPSSPITSSPEEPDVHFRYRHMSRPVGHSNGLVTPVSISPSGFPQSLNISRRLSQVSLPPPSIPRSRSERGAPISPPNSSSDESDIRPGRYRSWSQSVGSISPSLHRLTPPRSSPPDVPLPPIPSDDQSIDLEIDTFNKNQSAVLPSTPLRAFASYPPTPLRPLPIQPIPSPVPVPESDELDMPTDLIDENALRPSWQGSNGDLPSDIVVRQDSPVYMFHSDRATPTGIDPPPPYVEQLGTYFPTDITIGDSLDRLVNEYGGSSQARLVISKCIEFHHGYEPPYWQSRLQACGLNAEAAGHVVDEMCKQVDWAASFRRGA